MYIFVCLNKSPEMKISFTFETFLISENITLEIGSTRIFVTT
jgi:hypothetical protein